MLARSGARVEFWVEGSGFRVSPSRLDLRGQGSQI